MLNMKKTLTKMLDMLTVKDITPGSISGFITTNSGFTVANVTVKRYGRIASINFTVSKSTEMPAGQTQTIGTLKSDFRPIVNSGGASATFREIVGTDGRFYVRPATAVGADSAEAVTIMYLLA